MLGLTFPPAAAAGGTHPSPVAGRHAASAAACQTRPTLACSSSAASSSSSSSRRRQRPAQQRPCTAAASSLDEAAAAAAGGGGGEQPPGSEAAALQSANQSYLQHCQEQYGQPGLIDFRSGVNGLPKAVLQHPSGSRAEIYLHGAAVTSWRHSDGHEMLHLREGNAFDGEQPINGGIQISWPQYGVGPLPTHGFLQNLHWSVVDTAWREPEAGQDLSAFGEEATDLRPTISLYADTDEEWAEVWPHRFAALYTVTLLQPDPAEPTDVEVLQQAAERYQPWVARQAAAASAAAARKRASSSEDGVKRGWHSQSVAAAPGAGEEERVPLTPSVLRCVLQVHNCDDKPLSFTTGLRPHFATKDIPTHDKFVKTLGLRGKYSLDYAGNPFEPRLGVEDTHSRFFHDSQETNQLFVDCGPKGDILFCPGTPSHYKIENAAGFTDIGVVHPANVSPVESRNFVQLASARGVRTVTLQPDETWVGEMIITAHDRYWALPAWELEDSSGVPIPKQDSEQMPTLRPRRSSLAEISQLEGQGI